MAVAILSVSVIHHLLLQIDPDSVYGVVVSFVEIFNDYVFDLLEDVKHEKDMRDRWVAMHCGQHSAILCACVRVILPRQNGAVTFSSLRPCAVDHVIGGGGSHLQPCKLLSGVLLV